MAASQANGKADVDVAAMMKKIDVVCQLAMPDAVRKEPMQQISKGDSTRVPGLSVLLPVQTLEDLKTLDDELFSKNVEELAEIVSTP